MTKKLEEYSREELIEEIKALKRRKKFGLVWEDKKEDIVEKCKNEIPVLKEVPELAINEKPGEPTNLIIEGDNFASLQVLNYTHHGKIDVIYIDPPYNTGNKDFIYNDSYVDSEDSFRHSKWLSFMDRRLRLAKELLSDDGVIFISIDENELAHVKILCDAIFNENNLLAIFNWKKTSTPPSLSKNVRRKYEYVVCYGNRTFSKGLCGGTVDGGDMPLLNEVNAYGTLTFRKDTVIFKVKDGVYKSGIKDRVTLENDISIRNGESDKDIVLSGHFKWKQDTVDKEIENGTVFLIKSDKFAIRYQRDGLRIKIPSNIISKEECEVGTNEDATKEIQNLFNTTKEIFSHPKPSSLIRYLSNMITHDMKNATILDFFAGSGTTGQAVLELNKQDGGNRKFILCTNNESNIARDVTYPRIKTVVTGIRPDGSKYSDGISANVRYFKTDFVEKGRTKDVTRAKLFARSEEMICVRENAFDEVSENENYTFFKNSEKFVAIIKDPFNLGSSWYDLEKENKDGLPVKLYVFSYSNYSFEDEIPDTDLSYEICAIPNDILEVYRKTVEKKEDK